MQNHLSDYQKAALQVMGIPVWTLKVDGNSIVEHTSQWSQENRSFIDDLEYAISKLFDDSSQPLNFKWLVGDSLGISISDKTITAPMSLHTMSGEQKSLLWRQLQESVLEAN